MLTVRELCPPCRTREGLAVTVFSIESCDGNTQSRFITLLLQETKHIPESDFQANRHSKAIVSKIICGETHQDVFLPLPPREAQVDFGRTVQLDVDAEPNAPPDRYDAAMFAL